MNRWRCTGCSRYRSTLPSQWPYLRLTRFQGLWDVKEKRELFPGPPPTSSSSLALQPILGVSWGILTSFPFDCAYVFLLLAYAFQTELPYILGPTNSWPIAVLTKPFSTSVFKVLIWILATTTKICTKGCFIQNHFRKLHCNLHVLLLVGYIYTSQQLSMGIALERHPFSGPVHSAGELLHTP